MRPVSDFDVALKRSLANIHDFSERMMRFSPTWQQAEFFDLVQWETFAPFEQTKKGIFVKSGQGPGKCLRGDVEVLDMVTGTRCTILDLVERGDGFSVQCMDEHTEKMRVAPARAFASGRKQCLDLTVDSGQSIGLSVDHPVYTPEGWRRADSLRLGDLIAAPRQLHNPESGFTIVPDEVVRVIAYMMSDGSTAGTKCRFTQMPGPVLEELKADVEALGGSVRWENRYDYGIGGIRPLIRNHGLQGCKAINKRLPSSYFGLDSRQTSLFLNRFWACDGYFTKDGPEIVLANKGLIQDLQTLLLRLGIHSRFSYKLSSCSGKEFDAWRLRVTGKSNLQRWFECVGEVLGKEGRMPVLAENENTNTDVVPVKNEEWADITSHVEERGVRSKLRNMGFRGRSHAWMSRSKLGGALKALEELDEPYTGEHAKRATNDLYWVRVTGRVETGEHDVYDLEVPGAGNFVANNLIVHNTGSSAVAMLFRLLQKMNNKGLVTSPTRRQVQDIWISEFSKWVGKAPVELQNKLDIQASRVRVKGFPKWEILTATSVRPESVQGYHNDALTVMVDEASGIPRKIWETLKGTITEPGNLLMGIGNPNERDTEFFDAFNKDRDLYHLMTWNAEESPNVDKKHIDRMAEEYGKDSDVYRVRVLGEFPRENPNVVIRYEDLLYACREKPFNETFHASAPHEAGICKQFGIDLARFGGDESVVVARFNSAMVGMRHYTKWEPGDVIHDAFAWQRELGWTNDTTTYCVDAGGMGQGVMEMFYSTGRQIYEFHSHGKPAEPTVFNDAITEAYFQLRSMTREKQIHLKEDTTMFQQLVSRQYRYQKGLFRLESKDEYLKRVGTEEFTSPDRADSIALAFYPHASGSMYTTA